MNSSVSAPKNSTTHRPGTNKRRTAAVAALSLPLSAAGLFAAAATPASAAAKIGFLGTYTANGARIRANHNLHAAIGGLGYIGQLACVNVSDVPRTSGYYWNYNNDYSTGIYGWTAHSLIDHLYSNGSGFLIGCSW
jgi:hypothetical protein